ncbi:hypothetical protein Hanom_Chr16g01458571 [Helianthus anomalus]
MISCIVVLLYIGVLVLVLLTTYDTRLIFLSLIFSLWYQSHALVFLLEFRQYFPAKLINSDRLLLFFPINFLSFFSSSFFIHGSIFKL